MAIGTTHLFSGPPCDIEPTAVDHRSSGIYLKHILCFSLPQPQNNEQTLNILCKALQATVDEVPLLGTQIVPTEKGLRAFVPGNATLVVKDLADSLDYAALKASNFPQEKLDPDVLLPVEQFAFGDATVGVFKAQANFCKGGLFLSIAMHHFASDASGISFVVRALASNCRKLNPTNSTNGDSAGYYSLSSRINDRAPFYNFGAPGDITSLKAYTLRDTNPAKPAWMKETGKPLGSETFRLSSAGVKALKADSSAIHHPEQLIQEDATVPLQPFITSHDAICGLIWRSIMLARHELGIISLDETTNFKMPVEFRHLTDPPLAPDYIGNAFMQMSATIPVATLLGPNGLTFAAHAIRAGIRECNEGGARTFIKVIGQAKNPRGMYANIDDITGTQMLLTSWRKFNDVTLEWGEKFGRYDAFRLPHKGLIDGCPCILPALTDGTEEIAVTLDQEIMDGLKKDDTWSKYVTPC